MWYDLALLLRCLRGRFVEAADLDQASFLPTRLEDYLAPDNPVRVIDAFVDELDFADLGFARVQPAMAGPVMGRG